METPARVSQGRAAPIPQDLFDSAAIGMAVVDRASGRFVRANPALRALLGREEMELRGLTPCELIHPDDRAGWDEGLRLLRREPGETWRGEWRWLGPRGSVVWALVTATSAGNGFLVQVQDVSERRHAREARRRTEERLASVLFQAPVGLSVLEPDGTIALARGAAHPAHGARIEETVGRAVFDVYDVPEAVDSARRALAGEAVRATFAVGEEAYDVQFQPLRDDRGATAGAVVVATDVSDRERALAQLRERAAMGEAAARLGQRALDGLELDQVTFEAVAAVSDVLDVPHVGLLDLAAEDRSLRLRIGVGWEPDLVGVVRLAADEPGSPFAHALTAGRPAMFELARADHAREWARLLDAHGVAAGVAAPVGDPQHPIGVLVAGTRGARAFAAEEIPFVQAMANVIGSAVQRRQAEEAVRYSSLHDGLTGLPNRTLLADRTERAVAAARREGHVVGLLLLDLDDFKAVNDGLGHEAGDLVLRELARRMAAPLRETDTLARLGGDEFAVLAPALHSAADAELVARRVLQSVEQPLSTGGMNLNPRASVGIVVAPLHGSDMAKLLRRADVAMYRSKRAGGGAALYDGARDAPSLRSLAAISELRRAIDEGELLLHFQPKVRLDGGEVTELEALARWGHSTRGLVPPSQFVPLAERFGLVTPLTHVVLHSALSQLARWRRFGRDLSVAVNLSARTLHDPDLVGAVRSVLDQNDLPAGCLKFELTESAVMGDAEVGVRSMARLAELGVRFAIDDFGTGYSSLAYLQRLPVQALKIDRSFVLGRTLEDERSFAILRSIVELAHALGLEVVAEGVETRAALERLRDCGCEFGQGNHICPPLAAAEMTAWLDERERALSP